MRAGRPRKGRHRIAGQGKRTMKRHTVTESIRAKQRWADIQAKASELRARGVMPFSPGQLDASAKDGLPALKELAFASKIEGIRAEYERRVAADKAKGGVR